MIQTDPLSLVFIACFVFAATFLLATTLLGMGHAHGGMHLHAGHVHLGHGGGHVGHAPVAGHTTAQGHPTRVQVPHQQGAHAQQDAPAVAHPMLLSHVLENINLNAVLVFLFCFGLLGYVLHNAAHVGAVLTIVLAVLAGAGGAVGMNNLLMRLFGDESGRLDADSSEMEGRIATVSLPIRAEGIGEIIFTGNNGTRRSLGARSLDGSGIDRDAEVVIMSYRDGIADVQSWDHFIAGARNEAAAPPGRSN